MSTVSVAALGAFVPGYGSVTAWRGQEPADDRLAPDASLLPRSTNRRATPMTRMVADVLGQLCADGADPATVGVVLGTVGGELQTTFDCLALGLETPPSSSPLRFRNSLHNSLLGHLSIATHNQGFASAVAASRPDLVAMALLEGATFVLGTGTPCAVILTDASWPTDPCTDLAAGLLLSPAGTPGLGTLGLPIRGEGSVPMRRLGDAGVRANPSVSALDLVATLFDAPAGQVALGPVAHGWVAAWSPEAAS